MTYGVFILRSGQWALHATYCNLSDARQEARYLSDMLGIAAKVFRQA